jgi:hypothetical protein
MATLTKQHTFTMATDSSADEVNQNFDDLVDFVNGSVIHKDGSVAFTSVPSGPATDPTTTNQLTRKAYVDAGDKLRLLVDSMSTTNVNGVATPGTGTQLRYIPGSVSATVQAGFTNYIDVTLPGSGFPTNILMVLCTVGDNVNMPTAPLFTADQTKTEFRVYTPGSTNGSPIRINYLAVGW